MTYPTPLPECALIGGTPEYRLAQAVRLRRLGISVFVDTRDRRREKAFKQAADNNRWGKGGVYDLDDAEDRSWVDRGDV